MTQDYRKRAEKFFSHYSCEDPWYSCPKSEEGCLNESVGTECDCGYEDKISKLQNTFQQVAQEAVLEKDKEIERLKTSLKRGDCYCEVGIGNPMFRDHTNICKEIRGSK